MLFRGGKNISENLHNTLNWGKLTALTGHDKTIITAKKTPQTRPVNIKCRSQIWFLFAPVKHTEARSE